MKDKERLRTAPDLGRLKRQENPMRQHAILDWVLDQRERKCYQGHVGPADKTRMWTVVWIKHLINVKLPEFGNYDYIEELPCFQEIEF